jgi:hypothetical protein
MSLKNAEFLVGSLTSNPEGAAGLRAQYPCTDTELRAAMLKNGVEFVEDDALRAVTGGMRSDCGETSTGMSTCTKVDTNTCPIGVTA